MSLRNIGGGIAKVTNISSDEAGRVRIIDDHYMESFILEPGSAPLNIMINEAKIIKGLGANIAQSSSGTIATGDWPKAQSPVFYTFFASCSGSITVFP